MSLKGKRAEMLEEMYDEVLKLLDANRTRAGDHWEYSPVGQAMLKRLRRIVLQMVEQGDTAARRIS
jgi:hypothetical protein